MARQRSGEPKASKQRIDSAEKKRQALELRKSGVDYRTIADRLGYAGPAGAYKAVKTALLEITRQPAEEVRELEINRLDAMLLAISGQVRQGHHGAIDRALKIMERRARYLGLDVQPEQSSPTEIRIEIVGVNTDAL